MRHAFHPCQNTNHFATVVQNQAHIWLYRFSHRAILISGLKRVFTKKVNKVGHLKQLTTSNIVHSRQTAIEFIESNSWIMINIANKNKTSSHAITNLLVSKLRFAVNSLTGYL